MIQAGEWATTTEDDAFIINNGRSSTTKITIIDDTNHNGHFMELGSTYDFKLNHWQKDVYDHQDSYEHWRDGCGAHASHQQRFSWFRSRFVDLLDVVGTAFDQKVMCSCNPIEKGDSLREVEAFADSLGTALSEIKFPYGKANEKKERTPRTSNERKEMPTLDSIGNVNRGKSSTLKGGPTTESPSTILYDLIEESQWDQVLQRISSNPAEARRWVFKVNERRGNIWMMLPIHAAVLFDCPIHILKALIDVFPDGCTSKSHDGSLPIHLSCHRSESIEAVRLLLKSTPLQSILVPNMHCNTPIDLARKSNGVYHEKVLEMLLALVERSDLFFEDGMSNQEILDSLELNDCSHNE